MALARISVLVSGRGSNLGALLRAVEAGTIHGAVTHVVSNRPGAGALAIAQHHGVAASVVDHTAHPTREAFEHALARTIDAGEPDLIVLAGFMRVLGDAFVRRYAGRMINIHPSLLPAYPGLHTHRRALEDKAAAHGCTVHLVTPRVDVGPIVAQASLAVEPGDDESVLADRVLALEHRLLPAAVGWICAGRMRIADGRVDVRDATIAQDGLRVPALGPT